MTTETAPQLDQAKAEQFAGQMVGLLNNAFTGFMVSIGHRSGLFDVMATLPPSTSAEIAAAAGLNERYVREWLGNMATARIVELDAAQGTYSLPPEHAASVTRAAGPGNLAGMTEFLALAGDVEDDILEAFRNGGGVPYSRFTKFQELMRLESERVFDAGLVDGTLRFVPGVIERLRDGIDVLDVGTGRGHAINVMAKAFPNSRFLGVDFAEQAIAHGRAEAESWGLSNASFEAKDAAKLGYAEQFDFITTFDAVHDQADPAAMVQGIHAALRPGGYWLCVDIQASTHIGENLNHPMGTFGYTVSCMHCMTVSLAYDGVGLGAMWGAQQARQLFSDAGFVSIQIFNAPGDPMNNYYVCQKAP